MSIVRVSIGMGMIVRSGSAKGMSEGARKRGREVRAGLGRVGWGWDGPDWGAGGC